MEQILAAIAQGDEAGEACFRREFFPFIQMIVWRILNRPGGKMSDLVRHAVIAALLERRSIGDPPLTDDELCRRVAQRTGEEVIARLRCGRNHPLGRFRATLRNWLLDTV